MRCLRCNGQGWEFFRTAPKPGSAAYTSFARKCITCGGKGYCTPPPPENNRTGDRA